jgi:hypothetical protein
MPGANPLLKPSSPDTLVNARAVSLIWSSTSALSRDWCSVSRLLLRRNGCGLRGL